MGRPLSSHKPCCGQPARAPQDSPLYPAADSYFIYHTPEGPDKTVHGGLRTYSKGDQSVWERIIGAKGHSELRDRLDDVLRAIRTIRTPTVIQASTTDPESRLYYLLKSVAIGKYFKLYVVVAVKVDANSVSGRVRTAYLTAKPGKGRLLWAEKS